MTSGKPTDIAWKPRDGARFGGARAEFVASLGKKIGDARALLAQIERERGTPRERSLQEELRRRLHALEASARLLRFEGMAKCIVQAESVVDRALGNGETTPDDLAIVASALDDLPALAWGEPSREVRREPDPTPAPAPLARTAVIVGPAMLAEALLEDDVLPGSAPYECERTGDAHAAIDLARAAAPDVIVIDGDVKDAAELVEALLDEPMTEGIPVVVVGQFKEPKSGAKFVALGVARTLAKPITPESLRRACDEAVDHANEVTMRVTLGEPTLEQLGERLADEVRKALVDSLDRAARDVRVPLGEGTEVMSALWGAIARVREVVTARTGGAVRFGASGPEGAVAVAPWLHPDVPGTDRLPAGMIAPSRGRGPAADVRLHGRRVLVADDDPGVTWFIADLLRTAGCTVHEALDGVSALDVAYRTSPEIVISDILMPGLDGFALTRAMKHDVALRDVPVILLSWKEDLLQRVRELGATAAAYLRKESDSRAILARVRECLRPRARVEARLRGDGEARGRLDGLTVRSLLELACAIRPDSRVSVRDASFLYEVEIREGSPVRATRGTSEGGAERGERVLAAMLGVGAGRFTVTASASPIASADRDFTLPLGQLLAKPMAVARASRNVTTGGRAMHVERLETDPDTVATLLATTPEPARSLVKALGAGDSPRAMLLAGNVDPSLLEEVLGDLAARGAMRAVWTSTGEEVLARAVSALLAPPDAAPRRVSAPPPAMPSIEARPAPASMRDEEASFADMMPASLADAVIREVSERAPELRATSSVPPPIVEPSELRPRSSPPSVPTRAAAPVARDDDAMPMTPIPPDAVVPGDELLAGDRTEIDAPIGRALPPEDDDEALVPEESIPVDVGTSIPARVEASHAAEALHRTPLSAATSLDEAEARPAAVPAPRGRWAWLAAIGVLVVGLGFALQMEGPRPSAAVDGAVRADDSREIATTTAAAVTARPAVVADVARAAKPAIGEPAVVASPSGAPVASAPSSARADGGAAGTVEAKAGGPTKTESATPSP
jgi:CheY-like chemotaxis protein